MAETVTKEAVKTAEVVDDSKTVAPLEKYELPPVILKAEEYDKAFKYLTARYHVLTPVTAFSGMAPQHGLVVAKVLLDSDPEHGEVYQDKLFCKVGKTKDPLDDEVAIGKVGLRKLALAGGWNLSADVLVADRNYWVLRGYNRFVGLDGAVQTFAATEEYDLRDGSPQVRGWSQAQKDMARAHGLRGGEARALNAASREYGIKQKYTRRELQKPFVIMRMMFIPDASNEMQMRIVTERALQGTAAMFPQVSQTQALEPIEGMKAPIDASIIGEAAPIGASSTAATSAQVAHAAPARPVDEIPNLPDGYVLLRKVDVEKKKKRNSQDTFDKWHALDSNGEEHVTIKRDVGKSLMACWNQQDWRKGRPLEIRSEQNAYRENEIQELMPMETGPATEDEPQLPMDESV